MDIKNIVLIGSGNVATNLGFACVQNGFTIQQVFSRNLEHGQELAKKLNSAAISSIQEISTKADLYIICIKDSAIAELSKNFRSGKLVVHTSGSVHIDEISEISPNFGVFYPLDTFSKEHKQDFKNIPICIEANTKQNEIILSGFASVFSDNITFMDSAKRAKVHLAAIFASNFTNYLYSVAENLLIENGVSFNIIRPLIQTTAKKVLIDSPQKVQTGPAVRNDTTIIEKHLELLKTKPELYELYKTISELINKSANEQL